MVQYCKQRIQALAVAGVDDALAGHQNFERRCDKADQDQEEGFAWSSAPP